MMETVARCRSCKAPIIWMLTEKGHRMPLDPEPRPDGNIVVVRGVASVLKKNADGQVLFGEQARYVSHFVSCPDRQQHRRKR